MFEMMEEMFPPEVTWSKPQGGMFLWGVLPEEMDAAEVLKRAIEKKVAFVPGEAFHPRGGGKNTMRINFSYSSPDTIRAGVARLGMTLKELIHKDEYKKVYP
jgi:2-aminoadipate transaminase